MMDGVAREETTGMAEVMTTMNDLRLHQIFSKQAPK
jgi:hypothetical protein